MRAVGAVAGGGSAVGLLLGGVLTETMSWRWCLYVNLLFALPTAAPPPATATSNGRCTQTPISQSSNFGGASSSTASTSEQCGPTSRSDWRLSTCDALIATCDNRKPRCDNSGARLYQGFWAGFSIWPPSSINVWKPFRSTCRHGWRTSVARWRPWTRSCRLMAYAGTCRAPISCLRTVCPSTRLSNSFARGH